MEEKNISPQQSLQIIEKMLADTRNRFYNNGFAFLLWGVIIILACIADYLDLKVEQSKHSNIIWLSALLGGIIITVIYYAFIANKKRSFSKLDSINGKLWIGFGISFILIIWICSQYRIPTAPFIYLILGLCMFASGGIYKFWSLYFGAIVFWLGAITCVICKTDASNILISIAVMFLGYLVPGYLLWRKAKKETHV